MAAPRSRVTARHVRVARGTISNYVGSFVTIAIGFLITPFILSHLGPSRFGLWALANSFVAYGSLLDFGVSAAIVKYVAQHRANREIDEESRLLASALLLAGCLGTITLGLALVASRVFPHVFDVSGDLRETAPRLVLLMGLSVGITIPCAALAAILQGLQRFEAVNALNIVGFVVYSALIVLVLLLGGGLLSMVLVNIAVTLAMIAPTLAVIRRVAPDLRFAWGAIDRPTLRTIVSFSSSAFVIDVAGRLETKTDELVIGASLPISSVTPFALARRLSEVTQLLATRFLRVILPLASEIHAANDTAGLRALYLTSSRLTLALSLPTGVITILLAKPFLSLWVGDEYGRYAVLVTILTLAGMVDMSTWPVGFVFQGMGRYRWVAVVALATGLTNLILSLLLVRRFELTGVAVGTLVPTVVFGLGVTWPYAMRRLDVGLGVVVRSVLLPAGLPLVPVVLVVGLLSRAEHPGIARLAASGGIGLVLYAAGYLHVGASDIERDAARSALAFARRAVGSRLPGS